MEVGPVRFIECSSASILDFVHLAYASIYSIFSEAKRMKSRGIFKTILAPLVLLASYVKSLASIRGHTAMEGHIRGDRQGFASVSVPCCHTQKKLYKGFAR
jgi:hypothetical protein